MRARFAYITSLGTTAILVAAALLMLGLVGAIVAFHGWPGSGDGQGVHALPLAPDGSPTRVALVRRTKVTSAAKVVRARSGTAGAAAKRVSTAGLVKQVAGGGPPLVGGVVMVPVTVTTPNHTVTPPPNPPTQTPVVYQPDSQLPPAPSGPGPVPYTGVPLPGLAQVPLPEPLNQPLPDPGQSIAGLVPPLPPPPGVAIKVPGS